MRTPLPFAEKAGRKAAGFRRRAEQRDEQAPTGEAIRVRGLVQGVGFRPTVWRLAHDCGLAGDVCNDAEGVLIRIWGIPPTRADFLRRLWNEAPPLSRIDAVESVPLEGVSAATDFRIRASVAGEVHTGIVADAATCAACLADIRDVDNRRHGYAFTNCTHCGPRLSIVRRIPYDRAGTSMQPFAMCKACQAEYDNPADRRFHAQPNACARCGPGLWLESTGLLPLDVGGDPIETTQRLLRAGHIVAIKGLGGIHLACDATNAAAVELLRRRKQRQHKPFALMARDIDMIYRYCHVGDKEIVALQSSAAPIVLLHICGGMKVAEGVAPGQRCHGFMLPYTPLHHLLMAGLDTPVVLTSGNRSEEPQCIDNQEARGRLGSVADALLLHDRDIVNRLDDSVVRMIAGEPALLRRARGHAPAPLRLAAGFAAAPPVLAFGGEMKNTFCLLRDGEAIVSQHLGDLENAIAFATARDTMALYLRLFEHRPEAIVIDSHPEYLSSKTGREWAQTHGVRLLTVQHHHAHIAACLADNRVEPDAPPVLGIALDGLGYGDDGTLWGGEFLLADYRGYRRLAALSAVRMPGGTQAIHQPWRMAYAHLRQHCDLPLLQKECAQLPFFRALADKPLPTLDRMIDSGFNSPSTSSVGRLFDAVAAAIGLCQAASYEGQAAIALETAVDATLLQKEPGYPFAIIDAENLSRLDPGPMWQELLRDLRDGVSTGHMAARFHIGLAQAIAQMIDHLASLHGDAWAGRVALSGGVFQNAVLGEQLIRRLEARGLQVLRHVRVPGNDGGLSLGQAAVAAARIVMDRRPARARREDKQPCA